MEGHRDDGLHAPPQALVPAQSAIGKLGQVDAEDSKMPILEEKDDVLHLPAIRGAGAVTGEWRQLPKAVQTQMSRTSVLKKASAADAAGRGGGSHFPQARSANDPFSVLLEKRRAHLAEGRKNDELSDFRR
jgi:hypothetical protein